MMLAYFDCFSGISGDMSLGALLDLGVPQDWLKHELAAVPLDGFELDVKKVLRHGIHANRVQVKTEQGSPRRNFKDIQHLIHNSRLSTRVKQTSLAIFDKMAEAEARIHQVAKDRVHFHEIGAVDSLVDIIGTALCLEYLGIERIHASKIPLGRGFVTCSHGTLPLPAPATIEILKQVPVFGRGIESELTTPTGAAIIAVLAQEYGDMPGMEIEAVGYGAGHAELDEIPNLLRIIKGVSTSSALSWTALQEGGTVVVVETCIDDMNPEIFGYLMDLLFEVGALDVYWIPIFMKKNRPGTMIQVLCEPACQPAVMQRILSETTTIGLRYYEARRQILARENIVVPTRYGPVRAKRIMDANGRKRIVPEFEACREVARRLDIPIRDVYAEISQEDRGISLTKTPLDCKDES